MQLVKLMQRSRLLKVQLWILAIAGVMLLGAPLIQAAEPVVLYYAHWGDPDREKMVVDLFHESQSEIRIELLPLSGGAAASAEQILVMAAGGVIPDIFPLSGTQGTPPMFIEKGLLLDLTPYMERDGIREDRFVPNAWNYAKRNGRIWGWPRATFGISLGTAIIAYNRDMYSSAGLKYPASGWTFDNLLDAARRMTVDRDGDGKPEQWGSELLGYDWWQVFVWSNGGEILNEQMDDIRLHESKAIAGLQWMADLYTKYKVASPRSSGGTANFVQGRAALAHVPLSAYESLQGMSFDWGLVPPPVGPDGEQAYSLGGSNLIAVAAETEYPEAAWTFIKFLSEEWVHKKEVFEWKTATPNLRSVALSDRFLYSTVSPFDLTDIVYRNPAKPTPQHANWPKFNTLVNNALRNDVFTGKKSAEMAIQGIADALRAALRFQ
jgi:multiple sugar transport system substrate-binding protein